MKMQHPQNVKSGILCMILAMFIFAVVNVTVKGLASTYGVWQITFCRFFFVLFPVLYLLKKEGGKSALKPVKLHLLAATGIIGSFAVFILFKAFQTGRLADVTALAYSSILFVTALSVPFLKEAVGWRRWAAVVVGFSGVLLMANPDMGFQTGSLLAVCFAFMDAVIMILLRISTRYNAIGTTVFYMALFAALTAFPFMLMEFSMPNNRTDFALLAFLGLGGGVGQIFLTRAYSIAPAVAVAPMIYTSMIWGALFGIFFFGESLTLPLVSGAVIVILCSIYIIYRENVERNVPPRDLLID
ncbi:MAG: DMT family transporter [Alphaproteobacteria bacterium]|nr:DMT family transporter [Alphaproteobacteria bacterium]NCQ66787.1 DMT family transporter [Alphaproteobacteria bacterium]NCT07355.1 DMT family transporter [Alphaproteobacteria bacterium]